MQQGGKMISFMNKCQLSEVVNLKRQATKMI